MTKVTKTQENITEVTRRTMYDLTYRNRLKYITVNGAATEGNAEELAQLIEKLDRDSDPSDWNLWPKFGSAVEGEGFTIALDASELGSTGAVTWRCRIVLSSALDWGHPWEDPAIVAAEAIYSEHRNAADTRWTLPHIAADATRFMRECVTETYGLMTPMDADKLMGMFLNEAMPAEAEECERDPDPIGELLSEAMRDAEPISTGIAQLDNALGGGLHKGLSILAGDPAAGKTALGSQLALYCANRKEGRVLYCMADMGGKGSALLRMISCAASIAGVSGCKLGRADQWDARERYEGRMAFDRVSKGRIDLSDTTDVADLLRTLDASTERISLVVVDYAQALSFEERFLAFDPEAASLAVRELRAWAYDHDAAVLLLSAYSKSASEAHARGAAPSMADILGSAELSYSAEHVLALSNPHDGKGVITVRDLKARHASNASQSERVCTLRLDASHGAFS